jgi:hypothetical protein
MHAVVKSSGRMKLKDGDLKDSKLNLYLGLKYPKMEKIAASWQASGSIVLDAKMRGGISDGEVTGKFKIDDLFAVNKPAKILIEKVNLDFPFNYKFAYKHDPAKSKIAIDKSQLLDNSKFAAQKNFTIRSIIAKHPVRDVELRYLHDLKASIFFRNNTLEIPYFKTSILRGSFYGRDILFYLADLKKENIEYKLKLDITNVDIGRLDEHKVVSKKERDAELSMNINIAGKGLNFSKELSPSGTINIYKVGQRFANKLFKGLSEEQGSSTLGTIGQFVFDNTVEFRGFDYFLDEGLLYTTIKIKKIVPGGLLIGLEGEEYKIDRQPVQEYIRDLMKSEDEDKYD